MSQWETLGRQMGPSTRVSLRQSYRSAAKNMTTLLLTILWLFGEKRKTKLWVTTDTMLWEYLDLRKAIQNKHSKSTQLWRTRDYIMSYGYYWKECISSVCWLLEFTVGGIDWLLLLNNCLINVSIWLRQLRNTSKGIYWFVTLIKPSWNVQSYTIWIHYFISGLG